MSQRQFRRETEYGAAHAIADALFKRSLITRHEHRSIKAALIRKYRPVIGSLRKTATNDSPRNK